ncbi:MAG: hypothetical protein GY835_14535 [bacterium]|nr:hypothetical protein [bacterium]
MASTGSKILIGCSVGCLVVIIGIIAIGFAGYSVVRNIVDEFEDMEIVMDDVYDRFGSVNDFTPEADGSISPSRIEAFLELRDLMTPVRRKLDRTLHTLSDANEDNESVGPLRAMKLARSGVGLVPRLADFFNARNEAMLEVGIGPGEYYYIYVLGYYSWLGESLADGPGFTILGSSIEIDGNNMDDYEIREMRTEDLHETIQDIMLTLMRNQYDELDPNETDPELREWADTLNDEIEKLERDRFRIPWQDGLPDRIENSLRSYRREFKDSYSEMCAPLELGLQGY